MRCGNKKKREMKRKGREERRDKIVVGGQVPTPEGWATNVLDSTTKSRAWRGPRRGEGKEKEKERMNDINNINLDHAHTTPNHYGNTIPFLILIIATLWPSDPHSEQCSHTYMHACNGHLSPFLLRFMLSLASSLSPSFLLASFLMV